MVVINAKQLKTNINILSLVYLDESIFSKT